MGNLSQSILLFGNLVCTSWTNIIMTTKRMNRCPMKFYCLCDFLYFIHDLMILGCTLSSLTWYSWQSHNHLNELMIHKSCWIMNAIRVDTMKYI